MFRISCVGKNALRALLMALTLVLLFATHAAAADVDNWQDLIKAIEQNVDVKLNNNLNAADCVNIHNKNVTIDLNGHTITAANKLFNVSGNSTLTIKDSAQITVSRSVAEMPGRSAQNQPTVMEGTGIGRPASLNDSVLTYYETVSSVHDTISTTETCNKVDVTVAGRIVRDGNSTEPLIQLSNNDAHLVIEGGFFSNPNGRAVVADGGADVTITGGIFYGNHSTQNGGAIHVNNWNGKSALSITNAIFAGNSAPSGGAVATNGYVDMTLGEGAVFSGNWATGQGHEGGGAILIGWGSTATMSGGLITHNWCTANVPGSNADVSSYGVCGGGIQVHGTLKMTGGQVTSNEAPGGGGIATRFWDGGVFQMTGGIVAGNVARLNEGGGITININGRGSITGGHITNNKTEGTQHWGGGGVFAANDAVLTMLNTLISNNSAGGFGGGLAGCSTARVDTHAFEIQNHSAAIYSNKAAGQNMSGSGSTKNEDHIYAYSDPVFMRKGAFYQDYFSALNTTVCGGFLGQGASHWEGTIDSKIIARDAIPVDQKVTSQSVAGLTSQPSDDDIAKAISAAKVFVTGNAAYTHGGGILCNGVMIIGSHREIEIGDRMILVGEKTLQGDSLEDGQFRFQVVQVDSNGKETPLFTGTNNANGEIAFNGRLAFDTAGTYTYKVYELNDSITRDLTIDPTVYTIQVTVTTTVTKHDKAVDDDDLTKTEPIKISHHKISQVKVFKDNLLQFSEAIADRDSRNAYTLPDKQLKFFNSVLETASTELIVSKVVHDASNSSSNAEFTFTVTLDDTTITGTYGEMTFTNGVATFTLKGGQSKTAQNLPVGTKYTVTEIVPNGYYNPNPTKYGTITQGQNAEEFLNYAVGSLTLSKKMDENSIDPADKTSYFDFKIQLNTQSSGKYPAVKTTPNGSAAPTSVSFTHGATVVELKHGERLTINKLPAGMEYTVTELQSTDTGYDTAQDQRYDAAFINATGTIPCNGTADVSITNTRKTGELTLKKTVVGAPADENPEFTFTVTMLDATYLNGNFGGMEFTNGVATVKLSDGQSITATGLPLGIHYRIMEQHADTDDYAVRVVGESSGPIDETPAVVEFINTRFSGLVISKETTGSTLDRNTSFEFLIQTDSTLSGTYGDVTFTNGQATIFLKNGENVMINGLPVDTQVTVTEKKVSDHFIVFANGKDVTQDPSLTLAIGEEQAAHAHFKNLHRVGSLTICKTTVSPVAVDNEHVFAFHIKLNAPINGQFGDMNFTNGDAMVYLRSGQSVTADNIPYGAAYTVTEVADANFTTTVTAGKVTGTDPETLDPTDISIQDATVTGNIFEGETAIAYKNTRKTSSFSVQKVIQGPVAAPANGEAAPEFGFKITLDPPYTGTFGAYNFTDGIATFTLKEGGVAAFTDLPIGTLYTIHETTYDGQYVPLVESITRNVTHTHETVEYVNLQADTLTVSKTVAGNVTEVDLARTFHFTVTLGSTAINGTFGDMTFVNGVAAFSLKHGETKTATGLPEGIAYTVDETPDAGYITTSTGATGTISANGTAQANFINTKKQDVGGLTVTKTISGNAANLNDRFTFTVTLNDQTITGTYGGMTFTDGVATFTLGHSDSMTASDLPTGVGYTVTEQSGGYSMYASGDSGLITAGSVAQAQFVNSRHISLGSLRVTKTVTGEDASKTQPFRFTVELTGTHLNGTFGGMTFVNGISTFTLTDGQSMTASGLPAGIGYRVTEENGGYTVTATGDTGYIPAGGTAVAAFTNHLSTPKGDLRVSKFITGDAADMARKFTFRVTLNSPVTGTFGDMTFENGAAIFTLGHGETAVATRLPAGVQYTVEELDFGEYTVTAVDEVGTITADLTQQVTFINELNKIDIPQTGDGTNLPLICAALLLSLAGCMLLTKRRRAAN